MEPLAPTVAEVLEHEAFVRGLARAALGADDQVDDVVQETLAAGVRRGAFHNMRAWLATVARRRSVDVLRRDAARRRHEEVVRRAPPRTSPAPEELLAREEARRELVEELVALDPPSREVLVLRYHEDLPPREIAARLGVPVATVRTRIRRALARLRERLDARHGGDRRAWSVPLAAAFGWAGAVAATAATAGLLPWTVGVAAVAVLGVGTAFWLQGRAASPPPETNTARATDGRPRLEGSGRVLSAAPLARGTARVVGWVRRNGEPASATVELRRVARVGPQEIRAEAWVDRGELRDSSEPPVARTTTDARGGYGFEGLAPGQYDVRAVLASGVRAGRAVYVRFDASAASAELDLGEGPHVLAGRIVDPVGAPAMARVVVTPGDENGRRGAERPSVATDVEGRFTIAHLPSGRLDVSVLPVDEGFRPECPDTDLPASDPLAVRLEPALGDPGRNVRGRIEGTAVDGEGRPVAGVLVRSLRKTGPGSRVDGPARVSDEAGRFVLEGLGAGDVVLAVHERGWTTPGLLGARGAADPLVLSTDAQGRARVTLTLARAAALRGTVRDEEGAPVVGAVVLARPGTDHWSLAFGESWGVTGTDGSFRIDTVVPDAAYSVRAWSPDLTAEVEADVTTEVGPETRVDLVGTRIDASRWVEVEVRENPAEPRPSGLLRVSVFRERGSGEPTVVGSRLVGATGVVLVGPLPRGPLEVAVFGPAVPYRTRAPLTEPRTVMELKRERFIAGRLAGPPGWEPWGTKLTIESVDGGKPPPTGADWDGDLGEGGSFLITPLPAGRWRIRARDDGQLVGEVVAEAGTRDVVLPVVLVPRSQAPQAAEPAAEWRIRVLGPDDRPVALADVTLFHLRDGVVESTQGLVGAAEPWTYGAPRGATHVWLEARLMTGMLRHLLPLAPILDGPRDLTIAGGAIDLRVGPERRIAGVVRDDTGAGVRGAAVVAHAHWPALVTAGWDRPPMHSQALTDAEGRFDLGALADLDYELRLELPHGFEAPERPAVVHAGAADAVLSVVRAISPVVTVLDQRGAPIADAAVRAYPVGRVLAERDWHSPGPGLASAKSDAQGRAVLRGLSSDRPHVLEIGHADYGPSYPYRVEAWRPADVTVRVRAARQVRGQVLDAEGRPIARAHVKVSESHWITADAQGRFETPRAEAGVLRLIARHGYTMPSGDPVDVPEGTQDAVLRAPRGLDLEVRIARWVPQAARVSYYLAGPPGSSNVDGREHDVSEDGVLHWEGVAPGSTLSLVVHARRGDLVAAATGVRPGEPATIHLEPGAAIRGQLNAPDGTVPSATAVRAVYGACYVEGVVSADGTFVIDGLPSGSRVRVEAWAPFAPGGPHSRSRIGALEDVATGSRVTLDVRAP